MKLESTYVRVSVKKELIYRGDFVCRRVWKKKGRFGVCFWKKEKREEVGIEVR